jgi:hypothetical protein
MGKPQTKQHKKIVNIKYTCKGLIGCQVKLVIRQRYKSHNNRYTGNGISASKIEDFCLKMYHF